MIMIVRKQHVRRTSLCCAPSRKIYLHARVETTHHNSSRSFGSSSRPYEDDGLRWAKANPKDAKSCLAVPEVHSSTTSPSFTTWEKYWKWRCWKFPVQENEDEASYSTNVSLAKRLASHILSAPLTLAYHTTQHFPSLPQHWCCVGARAEATLPNEYWKELLIASDIEKKTEVVDNIESSSSNNNNNDNNTNNWALDFVGPDVPTIPSRSLVYNESVLDLHWHPPGYLHAMNDPPMSNLFILFNPGLGHSNLAKGWRPTIEYLVAKKAPLVLTAHSQRDAERDEKVLQEYFQNVQYELNPFRSRITYEDPFLKGHLVSPNQYVAVIKSPI